MRLRMTHKGPKWRLRHRRFSVLLASAFCYTAVTQSCAFAQSANPQAATPRAVHTDGGGTALSGALAADVALGTWPDGGPLAEVHLHNLSAQTITAYQCSLNVVYSDGKQVKSGWTEDLLGQIGIADRFADATFPGYGGFLGAGQTRTYKHGLRPVANGAKPIQADASVTAIVYKDRTAAGDPAFIQLTFAQRVQMAGDMAAVIAEMDGLFADSELREAATVPRNAPSAEKKFRQQVSTRMERLNQGSGVDKRRAAWLKTYFYDPYRSGGSLFLVKHALDGYKAMQAAYADGSTRREAK